MLWGMLVWLWVLCARKLRPATARKKCATQPASYHLTLELQLYIKKACSQVRKFAEV